ncbi:MAG: 5-(carboxyamino)imidazole ribonucleotide synthase [Pseudomonadota bacterium]
MALTKTAAPLPPGSCIGILGGGQLGRMLAMAAARLGLKTHIYSDVADAPAAEVAGFLSVGDYADENTLRTFMQSVQAVTYEFENVPAETVAFLTDNGAIVRPGEKALRTAQDRLGEKDFICETGAKTAPYFAVDDLETLRDGLEKIGRPAILKTRRFGYDGKGQTVIRASEENLSTTYEKAIEHAWSEVGAAPSILEGFVAFEREISVIAVRSADGVIKHYPPAENVHQNGILKTSTVPARIDASVADNAAEITKKIMDALDYVGAIGVEFFVLPNGDLIVNEFAPRVHNSGHWTMDACAVCQFEQQIRAAAGWPLAEIERHSNAMMENLLGDDAATWSDLAEEKNAAIHLYGKAEARPGRKMGHVNRLSPFTDS